MKILSYLNLFGFMKEVFFPTYSYLKKHDNEESYLFSYSRNFIERRNGSDVSKKISLENLSESHKDEDIKKRLEKTQKSISPTNDFYLDEAV